MIRTTGLEFPLPEGDVEQQARFIFDRLSKIRGPVQFWRAEMAEKLYFAYGSNINLKQMAYRCPECPYGEPYHFGEL